MNKGVPHAVRKEREVNVASRDVEGRARCGGTVRVGRVLDIGTQTDSTEESPARTGDADEKEGERRRDGGVDTRFDGGEDRDDDGGGEDEEFEGRRLPETVRLRLWEERVVNLGSSQLDEAAGLKGRM